MRHLLTRDLLWNYQADEGGGAAAAPAGDSAPSTPAAPTESAASTTAAAPTSTAASSGASPTPASAQISSAPSWLEQVRKEAGFDPGADEKAALSYLKNLHTERQQLGVLQQYAPHISAYVQNAQAFSKWQEEQAKAAQAKADAERKANVWDSYWNPPEYNPAWERHIQVNPQTGRREWAQDAPLDIQQKYAAYQSYAEDQIRQFRENPHKYMLPTIEATASRIAEELVQKHLAQAKEQQDAAAYVQQHSNWLYEQELDASGKPIGQKMQMTLDPATGQFRSAPVLSFWGKRYQEHATHAHRLGLPMQEVVKYAEALTDRDAKAFQLANQGHAAPAAAVEPPKTPQQKANESFLAKNNPTAPMRQPKQGQSTPAEAGVNGRNLEQLMRKALQEAGFNDSNM